MDVNGTEVKSCEVCGTRIFDKPSYLCNRKFCSRKCSAKGRKQRPRKPKPKCEKCGKEINRRTVRLLCQMCSTKYIGSLKAENFKAVTKGDLFERRCNWQCARSAIQRNAKAVFMQSCEILRCVVCGYSNHVEVCHIKSVSEFDNSSTMGEINSLDNLVGLCPNHHWEFDNGILKPEQFDAGWRSGISLVS